MMLALWFTLAMGGTFDDELPSLEVIKAAFKQNLERIANRRVKYVRAKLAGAPKKEVPPLDHPGSFEQEVVISKDGRWRSQMGGGISVWDGSLYKRFNGAGSVEIHRQPIQEFDTGWFEMGMIGAVEQLGIRSKIRASSVGKGLVELIPKEDSRVGNEVLVLDPTKNYWPVRNWTQLPNDAPSPFSQLASEFEKIGDGWWYPKHIARTYTNNKNVETYYYTVVSAEFPPRFDDDVFRIAFPEGTVVNDNGTRYRIQDGKEVLVQQGKMRGPTLMDRIKGIPGEDWLFYGGFGAAVMAVVGAGWWTFGRKRKDGSASRSV